jgi:hypothetical protein
VGSRAHSARLLQDLDPLGAQLFNRCAQVLDYHPEVVVRVADVVPVAGDLLALAWAANQQVDAVQSHHHVGRVAPYERLRAEHLTIEAFRRIQVAAHQVHVIEPKTHVVIVPHE